MSCSINYSIMNQQIEWICFAEIEKGRFINKVYLRFINKNCLVVYLQLVLRWYSGISYIAEFNLFTFRN